MAYEDAAFIDYLKTHDVSHLHIGSRGGCTQTPIKEEPVMVELRDHIKLTDAATKGELLDLLSKIIFLWREGDTNAKSAATYTKEWAHKTLTVKVTFK